MGFFDKLLGRSGQLRDKAGKYASEHGDAIGQRLDKAGEAANKATKGRLVRSLLEGLRSVGGNQWEETSESGQAVVGAPLSGSLGALQAAAVEDSNIDLTEELVNMITAQRAYQANAQAIKTQDQTLQTIVNLR